MDFLDRFALWVENQLSSSHKENTYQNKTKEGSISADADVEPFGHVSSKEEGVNTINSQDTSTPKRKMKRDLIAPKASFAEKNFKNPDKILNDNYIEDRRDRHTKYYSIFGNLEDILPFIKRKTDFYSWLFRNKIGALVVFTIYVFTLMATPYITFKFDMIDIPEVEGILIDFQKVEELEEMLRKLQEEGKMEYIGDIDNKISDESSEVKEDKIEEYIQEEYTDIDSEKLLEELANQGNSDYMNSHAGDLDKLELDAQGELNEFYKQREASRAARAAAESEFSKKSGNVTVSFNLAGRRALFLEVPSYLCRGGGKVVVSISVNRMGDVVSANVIQTIGVKDPCLTETAIWAAKRSKFNYKEDAESRQKGTITYMFVAQ